MAQGRFDIVIGTQLVAKGHHFPKLNLVGIVDADLGLANGDPRAAERTFQLLHQVVGRAGREEGRGYGYLQTHQPEHPVMRALIAQDREAFYSAEIEVRENDALSAVRAAREPADFRRRQARHRRPMRARSRRSRRFTIDVRVLGPGRSAARRGARALSLPPAGEVAARRSISRPICANGSPLCPRRKVRSSSKSTSIRRAFSSNSPVSLRHARACRGHPRLSLR